jgi:hypothetical protein
VIGLTPGLHEDAANDGFCMLVNFDDSVYFRMPALDVAIGESGPRPCSRLSLLAAPRSSPLLFFRSH